MSPWAWIIGGVILLAAATAFGVIQVRAQQSGRSLQAPSPEVGRDAARGLRDMALKRTAEESGFKGHEDEAYGVVLDWGIEGETVTVVAFASGDASLYMSSGGGVIGGSAHARVRNAAGKAVAIAGKAKIPPSEDLSLPGDEKARITVLTAKGRRSAVAEMEALGEGKHELSPVFYAINEVISELRRISER